MRSIGVALLTLAAVLGLAGCEPRTDRDPTRRIYCQVFADAPSRDSDEAPSRIIGRARFWCDQPGADRLALTLRLQRQDSGGAWQDIVRTSFTVSGRQTVRTDSQRYRTREVTVSCSEGRFRTVVTGRSDARGLTARYDLTSAPFTDPCASLLAT